MATAAPPHLRCDPPLCSRRALRGPASPASAGTSATSATPTPPCPAQQGESPLLLLPAAAAAAGGCPRRHRRRRRCHQHPGVAAGCGGEIAPPPAPRHTRGTTPQALPGRQAAAAAAAGCCQQQHSLPPAVETAGSALASATGSPRPRRLGGTALLHLTIAWAALCCWVGPVSAEYQVVGQLEGGNVDILKGRFSCPSCNSSRDCGVRASRAAHQEDGDWRIWRTDNGYRAPELRNMRLCIRKWMVGCNSAEGPTLCNSYTEVCMASHARHDVGVRTAPHEVCSMHSFMSPASFTLIITIPIFLCVVSVLSIIATLHHSFANGYCQCPPSFEKLPVMMCAAILIVFSFLTYFSPHFTCGVVGMFIGVLAIVSQTVVSTLVERCQAPSMSGYDHEKSMTLRAQRWLFAAATSTFSLVYLAWGGGYPSESTPAELGKQCTEFYNFFVVDQRLAPQQQQGGEPEPFWGYCELSYVEDTLWNVTAVLWLGLALGVLHLHSLASLGLRAHRSFHRDDDDEHSREEGAVRARGPGAFLMTSQSKVNAYVNLDFTVTGRHRREHFHSVESYNDVDMTA